MPLLFQLISLPIGVVLTVLGLMCLCVPRKVQTIIIKLRGPAASGHLGQWSDRYIRAKSYIAHLMVCGICVLAFGLVSCWIGWQGLRALLRI